MIVLPSGIGIVAPVASGGVGAHDYWRLNITANNGDAYLAIQEIELLIAGVDQTINPSGSGNAIANASTWFSGTSTATQAFDGNYTTPGNSWVTAAAAGGVGWISYRFGWTGFQGGGPGPLAIDAVKIWPQVGLANRAPRDFTIETSPDGTNWTVQKTVTGQTGWVSGTPRTFSLP